MPDILNDGSFDIATGRSRKEKNWRNKEMLWSELVEKLSVTHYTAETHAEYVASKKPRQDEIKDIGGFVGGHLTGGRRKASAVLHRQLLTLDLDFATSEFWDDLVMLFSSAALVYSTHKHSAEHPRYRLIIPLDRPVRPDEYEAIARKVAGIIDIELFDPTTFQPERLMYWPSTSKGSEYVFTTQDGPWLSADEILGTYHDWRDSSEWPVSAKVDKILQRTMIKQGDPLEKPGIVGAFCRTYDIHQAIDTYLSDVYEPVVTDGHTRYTYKEGSTAAGLVIYDDKYAFSHHGTDPTSGKLCNAFDLVRIHKYHLKDEDAREGTPGSKLPSYTAMLDLASRDPEVKKRIVNEKLDDAKSDFDGITDEDLEDQDDSWKEKLDVDRKGNVYCTTDNILMILENDPRFKKRFAYDEFEKCEVAVRDLTWREVNHNSRRLIDRDDAQIRRILEKSYGVSSAPKTKDAMDCLALKTAFHPVKKFLQSLSWDGKKRLEKLLVDYQGAIDSEYTRTVTRKMLVAAISRIFNPGIKFDHVLVLVGKQGLKKSGLIDKLGRQWFSDSFNTIEGKEAFEQLQGVWLIEIAELSGLARAEVEKIKHFISKRDDRYRVAFGRRTERFPRQCVFFATTNKRDFLRDPSGDRRYWPVLVHVIPPTKNVFQDLTDSEIGQIWAEAMEFYKKGETIYLDETMAAMATKIQKDHTEEHPWTGVILKYLDIKIPTGWNNLGRFERTAYLNDLDQQKESGTVLRTRVCLMELWEEALNRKDTIDDRSANFLRNIMLNIEGWMEAGKQLRYSTYGPQRKGYVRVGFTDESLEELEREKAVPMV